MNILINIFVLMIASSAFAVSGKEAWKHANMRRKVQLLEEYRTFFMEYQRDEILSELVVKTHFMDYFLSSAWANGEMNCIYAGWPSKRVNNVCSSPARHNPDYQNGPCKANEMQCQPLLFGKGLCVPVATQSQRSLAFSNCDKKKTVSNEALIREIKADGNERLLFELMDFADKICTQGKQAGTGMCVRLKARVDSLKPFKDTAPIEVAEDSGKTDRSSAVTSTTMGVTRSIRPQVNPVESELIHAVTTATRAIQSVSAEDCEPVESGDPFDREVPRPLNFEYTTARTAPEDPNFSYQYVKDKGGELRPTGFELSNIGPNHIAGPAIDPDEKTERTWSFTSTDNSRRETYLWITDDPGSGYLSDLMETMIVLVPRKMKPKIEPVGNDLHVTLTTGEKVIFDKKTRTIKGGALHEGKLDTNRDKKTRKFAAVSYSGTGISIRVDKRGGDPRLISGNATVTQNGKSCQVPARELWAGEEFRYADDRSLVNFLNRKCGNKFSI